MQEMIEELYQVKCRKYSADELDAELQQILYTEAAVECAYSEYTQHRKADTDADI